MKKDDGLPQRLCEHCIEELKKFYSFKHQIITNDSKLHQILSEYKKKDNQTYCNFDSLTKSNTECFDNVLDTLSADQNSNQYKCDICTKKVLSFQSLRRHMKIHSGEKTHMCEICNRSFIEKGNLKKHMRRHTNEKKHQCNECGLRFYERNKLAIHMRTHSGEKPYTCTVCSKSFNTASQVQIHMNVSIFTAF